jgi:hypothetical protein
MSSNSEYEQQQFWEKEDTGSRIGQNPYLIPKYRGVDSSKLYKETGLTEIIWGPSAIPGYVEIKEIKTNKP